MYDKDTIRRKRNKKNDDRYKTDRERRLKSPQKPSHVFLEDEDDSDLSTSPYTKVVTNYYAQQRRKDMRKKI